MSETLTKIHTMCLNLSPQNFYIDLKYLLKNMIFALTVLKVLITHVSHGEFNINAWALCIQGWKLC